jgi:hypothetical protein
MTSTSDLRHVLARLAKLYSPDETNIWLTSRHQLLNGERPLDVIRAGRAAEVLRIIEELD